MELKSSVLRAMVFLSACSVVQAETGGTVDLLKLLVEKGVLTVDEAKKIIAEERVKENKEKETLRIMHIPESVRESLAEKVKSDLKDAVVKDVVEKGQSEGWAIKDAMPEWLRSIKIGGDYRFRMQQDSFGKDNASLSVIDYQVVNERGSRTKAAEKGFINTTEDRFRIRNRLRLHLDATINDNVSFFSRLATGSLQDPVSTNATLGSYSEKQAIALDQAYIHTKLFDQHLNILSGRMPNPFSASDLMWDSDLSFEGVSSQWILFNEDDAKGHPVNAYFIAGAFPLQEIELSEQDKWLYAAEVKLNWTHLAGNKLTAAVGYYGFDNISGEKNSLDGKLTDYTAPKSLQRGNSVFDIRSSSVPSTADELFALASDYNNLDFVLSYDISADSERHLILRYEFTTNLGYDSTAVASRMGLPNYQEEVDAYKFDISWGNTKISKKGDWNIALGYRHTERDAMLDAFNDSDFLFGGTDSEGYVFSGEYGVLSKTSVKFTYISAASINPVAPSRPGRPIDFDSDTAQIDLAVKF
jgi:hypothetical protein